MGSVKDLSECRKRRGSLDQLNCLYYRTLDAGTLLVAVMGNDHPLAKQRAIRMRDLRGLLSKLRERPDVSVTQTRDRSAC